MVNLKSNFSPLNKLDKFFTHGKIQITNDYKYILCGFENKVNVFNISTGLVEFSFYQDDDSYTTCFFLSPDDEHLVTSNKEFLLRQWNFKNRSLIRTWKSDHQGPISVMDFDSTSTLLCTGSSDSSAKVWDLEKKYCTNYFRKHSGVVSLVKFNPNNSCQLLTSCDNYKIKMWDLNTQQCLFVLEGHYSLVTSVQFSPDSKFLYSASRDKVVLIWNLEDKTRKTIPVFESVESLILFSKSSKEIDYLATDIDKSNDLFALVGSEGKLSLWNANTGQCIHSTKQQNNITTTTATEELKPLNTQTTTATNIDKSIDAVNTNSYTQLFLVDGMFVIVTDDQNIIFLSSSDFSVKKQFVGNNDHILDMKFMDVHMTQNVTDVKSDTTNNSTTVKSYLVVANNSNMLKLYNTNCWSCSVNPGHKDIIVSVDTVKIKDQHYVVTGSKDNNIGVWKLVEPEVLQLIALGEGHTHTVNTVAFLKLLQNQGSSSSSSVSSSIFIVSGSNDKTLKLWKFATNDTKVKVKLTVEGHEKDINSLAISPDHKLIATGSKDKTAKLWNRNGLTLIGTFKGHKRGVWSVQFSNVDKILATSSADSTIKLWDVASLSCIKTFEGHEGAVLKVSFLCRGMQLISCGSDGLMKLWTVKTNECVKTIDAHDEQVWAMCVDQSESRVATGAGDGSIIYWKDVSEEEKLEAVAKSQEMKLKEQELSNYLHSHQYGKALSLAISLDLPNQTFDILKQLLLKEKDLGNHLVALGETLTDQLMAYSVVWNQNSKKCLVSQHILNFLLRHYSQQQLLKFNNLKKFVVGMTPYTERHYARLKKLVMRSTFANYLCQVSSLDPYNDNKSIKDQSADDGDSSDVSMESDF